MGGVGELTSLRPTGCIGVLTTLCAKAVRGYKTITPKMSAFGTSTPCYAPPEGACPNRGRCPHPRSPRGGGCRRRLRQPLHPNHRALGRLQPVKAKPLRGCFASLDRFPAPSASDRFSIPTEMERVKGDVVVHFTLDALESTQHSAQGMWIGFATCPCGLTSEWGLGQSPMIFPQIRPNNVI